MELATIEMSKAEAREKFLEYKRGIKDRQDAETKQIMDGYKALANGHQVIDIVATIKAGGATEHAARRGAALLPNLAVMRADQRWCHVSTDTDGKVVFYNRGDSPKGNERRNVVRLPAGTIPVNTQYISMWSGWRSMVPPVPPGLMPKFGLGNYHVLYEAEWENIAPKDPALLKHIGGDLFVVLAVWDLTELERTVLAGRFRR